VSEKVTIAFSISAHSAKKKPKLLFLMNLIVSGTAIALFKCAQKRFLWMLALSGSGIQ
jgi:hypothetical protein